MSLGQGTQVVDGQRNLFPTSAAFHPVTFGQQTTGVPQVSPTMPPYLGGQSGAAMAGYAGVGGYGTADNNAQAAAMANANPHNWKVSPVWWAVAAGVAGLLLLNGIHWRKTTLEGADEHAHLGRVSESASESA